MKSSIFQDIKSLKIQGATDIAISSLEYLKKFSERKGFGKAFDKEIKKLLNVRPTAVVLYNVIQNLKKEKSRGKINHLLKILKESRKKVAENGEHLIKNNSQVHIHCHASHVISLIKKAAEKKKFTVIADKTEPKLQGIKSAKELSKIKNIHVVLIADNAAGLPLSGAAFKKDDLIMVGADAIREEGVVNKIGTYLLAVAAKEQKIPFYVATTLFAVDKRKIFRIEERPPGEVYKKIRNVEIRNPAFDITPLKYITGFITEDGIKTNKDILEILK